MWSFCSGHHALNNLQLVLDDTWCAFSLKLQGRGQLSEPQIRHKNVFWGRQEGRQAGKKEGRKGREGARGGRKKREERREGVGEGFQLLFLSELMLPLVLLCKVLFTLEWGGQEHKVYKRKENTDPNIYGQQSFREWRFHSSVRCFFSQNGEIDFVSWSINLLVSAPCKWTE